MKFRFDKDYVKQGVTLFLVACSSILFYYFVFKNHSLLDNISKVLNIFMPIIYGGIIAYILRPCVDFLEKKPISFLLKKANTSINKLNRSKVRLLSILLTLTFFLLVVYGLMYLLIPQLIYSVQNLVIRIPSYAENFRRWVLAILEDNADIQSSVNETLTGLIQTAEKWLTNTFIPKFNVYANTVSTGVVSVVTVIKNLLFGIIVACYILAIKESLAGQFKKLTFALFGKKRTLRILRVLHMTDHTFSDFISGKLLDSLIIGIICFVITMAMKMPYYVLISVIVGVTNIIPFFGPYIGAVPCLFLILIVNPMKALYFLIFIILLQTFDGNYLGPKILGNATGLNSFFVLCSIIIFGGMFGVVGMIIGVPTTAVLYYGIRTYTDSALREKGLPTQAYKYTIRPVEGQEMAPEIFIDPESGEIDSDHFEKEKVEAEIEV